MHDYSYSAHLVINDGYEDRLDVTITCQNAQQLLRAKDLIADQMNAYIAEFAVQSGLTGVPSNAEQNAAALQAVIQEQTEKVKQQEPEEPAEPELPEAAPDEPEESPPSHDDALDAVCYRPDLASFKLAPTETPKKAAKPEGAKGLMRLRCPKCGDEFVAFTKDYRTEWTCKECGAKFSLENTALFEYDCSCGRHTYGQTNIESPDFSYPCGDCGKETTAGSGTTSQDSSGRTASRETIRIHSPTREATGWTPKESTKAQPFPLTSKETRYGQGRIDRPV